MAAAADIGPEARGTLRGPSGGPWAATRPRPGRGRAPARRPRPRRAAKARGAPKQLKTRPERHSGKSGHPGDDEAGPWLWATGGEGFRALPGLGQAGGWSGPKGRNGSDRRRRTLLAAEAGRLGPTPASKQERGEGAGPLVHDPIICREPGRPPPEQGTNQGGTLPETNPGDGVEPRAAFGDERDLLSPN